MFLRALASLWITLATCSAQFYAPDTDFHTPPERLFPVEAARVLADIRNHTSNAGIAEIRYELSKTPAQSIQWILRWLDASGNTLRERKVEYPEAALQKGAAWHRLVVAQLCGDDWKIAQNGNAEGAVAAFWSGAVDAGIARLEGVRQAGAVLQKNSPSTNATDAARLAGILAQAATPSIASSTMLDALLVARASAWLAIAELASKRHLDAAWSVILLKANRRPAALAAWPNPPNDPYDPNAARRYQSLLLREPPLHDVLRFAADPGNRQFAMPVMVKLALFDASRVQLLADVASALFDNATLNRCYDYAPLVTVRGGLDGGTLMDFAPNTAMRDLVKTLETWQPSKLDFTGYRSVMPDMSEAREGFEDGVIRVIGPLIQFARDQGGTGPLTPVSAVTTRDLLFYGWECAGLQFGYRHYFIRVKLGHRPSAATLANTCFILFKDVDPFFDYAEVKPKHPLTDTAVLQFSNSSTILNRLSQDPPPAWRGIPDALFRKRWPLDAGGNRELEAMVRAGATDEQVKSMVARLMTEGGPAAYNYLLANDQGAEFVNKIKELGLQEQIAKTVPYATWFEANRIKKEFARKSIKLAQEMEKLEWADGAINNSLVVFREYMEANAIDAAKRYYNQAFSYVPDVDLSNGLAQQRFALALLEDDDAAMRHAIKVSYSGSLSDYRMQVAYAVIKGNFPKAKNLIERIVHRYSRTAPEKQFADYLPLIPALKDPAHPQHREAVTTFPRGAQLQLIQWWLLQQAKLPKEEAVEFLGGSNPEEFNRFLIDFIEGNVEAFDRDFRAAWPLIYPNSFILGTMLSHQLHKKPPAPPLPDLKPANFTTLKEIVRQAAKGR